MIALLEKIPPSALLTKLGILIGSVTTVHLSRWSVSPQNTVVPVAMEPGESSIGSSMRKSSPSFTVP